jgi:multiple sugar transport system ATP-binding protein
VYVTHDQVEAMTMADRIVVMRGGIIEQSGKPLELYDDPANIFVAQFIGSPAMNIIEGEVRSGAFETADGLRLALPPSAVADRQTLSYGIRPEHIRIAEEGLPGIIHIIEPTGASTEVIVRAGAQQIAVTAHERILAQPGDQVHLAIDTSKVCLFDAEGGRIRNAEGA